jgi:hypothetical protein
MKKLAFLAVALAVSLPIAAQAGLQQFKTEADAQKSCKDDKVVWLNTAKGVYHFAGTKWYGKSKAGAYVCRHDADAAGNKAGEPG